MNNTLSAAEIKRRGFAAIEEGLRSGPVHLVKRNRLAAVVVSEEEYQRLIENQPPLVPGMTAIQWLLAHPGGTRSKADIDSGLADERAW